MKRLQGITWGVALGLLCACQAPAELPNAIKDDLLAAGAVQPAPLQVAELNPGSKGGGSLEFLPDLVKWDAGKASLRIDRAAELQALSPHDLRIELYGSGSLLQQSGVELPVKFVNIPVNERLQLKLGFSEAAVLPARAELDVPIVARQREVQVIFSSRSTARALLVEAALPHLPPNSRIPLEWFDNLQALNSLEIQIAEAIELHWQGELALQSLQLRLAEWLARGAELLQEIWAEQNP